jgi:TonB family protein
MQPDKTGLPKAGVISLLLHIALITFLSLNLRLTIPKSEPSVYRVTLRPFSPLGNETPQGVSSPSLPGLSRQLPASPANEKPKAGESKIIKENTSIMKFDRKKAEKKTEKPVKKKISLASKKQKTLATKKDKIVAKEQKSEKTLEEDIEGIQHKVAVEDIEKRVEQRGPAGEGSSGLMAGGGAPRVSPDEAYGNVVKEKIMKKWALPENFSKEEKTFMIIIDITIGWDDGKVKKLSFEKSSGNDRYDQMAIRAIRQAEPFPPIPKDCMEDTFGIKFSPDQLAK